MDYLRAILTARVYDVAIESPLQFAPGLSGRTGNNIFLKREDMQQVRSFKVRGAYNKMVNLTADEKSRGVVCASAGNHAQGVALAANKLSCRAMIVMPTTTPPVKIAAVKSRGGPVEIIQYGDTFAEALAHAKQMGIDRQMVFVHPYDDPLVIAGQGTIGMEILRQHQDPLHAVFVAIGGGGMVAGISAYIKQVRPEIRVIGVQTVDSTSMVESIAAGHQVALTDVGLFADGTAVKCVGKETLRLAQLYVDEILLVTTDQVCAALKDVFLDTRTILEPSGAMSIAAAKLYCQREQISGQDIVCVACGANMNFDRLRFVVERAELGEQREALMIIQIPKQKSLHDLIDVLPKQLSITEIHYSLKATSEICHLFLGMTVVDASHTGELHDLIESNGFNTVDVSRDDLSKNHLRYMIGGQLHHNPSVHLVRIELPERPGCIGRVLENIRQWPNCSLVSIDYRNQGGDVARVMIAVQGDKHQVELLTKTITGKYVMEDENAAWNLMFKQ